MSEIVDYLAPVAVAAVAIVLVLGLINMMRGQPEPVAEIDAVAGSFTICRDPYCDGCYLVQKYLAKIRKNRHIWSW